MALLFCDGGDHWTGSTQGYQKWTGNTSNSGAPLTTSAGNGRFSTASIYWNGGSNGGYGYKNFTDASTIIAGLAWRRSAVASRTLFRLSNSGTIHVDVRTDASGFLYVTRNGTQLGSTTSFQTFASTWVYVELKVFVDDSTGTVDLRANGVSILSLTGQDTRNGATTTINRLEIPFDANENGGGATLHIDDVYVCDTSTSSNNDFLGDVRVQTILPNGNGNSSVLVGSDGNSTDNYLLVDDATPDDDTTYVQSSGVGDKDTYAYGNVTPTSGTVRAVAIHAYSKKTDAGARQIVTVARHSGTEEDSSAKTLGVSYQYHTDYRPTKPGGGAWSISDVNNAEFGVKVST